MVQSSDPVSQPAPPAVPMKRGSYVKGIALSLLFQGIAGFAGAVVYAWGDVNPGISARAKDVTQMIGFLLAISYGFTHWILAGSPSFFCLTSALIGLRLGCVGPYKTLNRETIFGGCWKEWHCRSRARSRRSLPWV